MITGQKERKMSVSLSFLAQLYAHAPLIFDLISLRQVKDPKCHHDFVSTGVVNSENELIVYYAGNFKNVSKQYGTVATLKFNSESRADEYTTKQNALMRTSTEPQPIVFRSKANTSLHDVFFGESEYGDQQELFDCYVGMPSHGSKPFMTANMKVFDVPQYDHFDDDEYPESSSYFMYGDKKNAFLFHIPAKNPDFLQVIILSHEREKMLF